MYQTADELYDQAIARYPSIEHKKCHFQVVYNFDVSTELIPITSKQIKGI